MAPSSAGGPPSVAGWKISAVIRSPATPSPKTMLPGRSLATGSQSSPESRKTWLLCRFASDRLLMPRSDHGTVRTSSRGGALVPGDHHAVGGGGCVVSVVVGRSVAVVVG